MVCLKEISFIALMLGCSVAAAAQPGITDIGFTGTSVGTGSWEQVPSPNFWNIRALLLDGTGHAIGSLSPSTTLNTASAPFYPTGFRVTLGQAAPADAVIVVYRSKIPFGAGDAVDKAVFAGMCSPAGCPAGNLEVPASGDLVDSLLMRDANAMPVRLQEFSVD